MIPTKFGNIDDHKYINGKKVVMKPWGKEVWLELNDKYCYKRIYINAGFKTSYQMHNIKLETNFIIDGKAEVWLENDDEVVEKFIMTSGDFFTVIPPKKHRVIALTDLILQEVSTPEVDDVIRINDEFNRSNGKIEAEHFKPVVCILAAGLGSRLGKISSNTHKSLLPLKNKAILSHIINKFDKDHDIVIAVGHLKEQVKEYLNLYHNDRVIRFVDVDLYDGNGSGPAYSLECCREYLQRPFYFSVSDFYTEDELQNITFSTRNWISINDTNIPELYSTILIEDGKIKKIKNKSVDGYDKAFSGIFYMYDYKLFWKQFDKYVDEKKEVVDIFKNIQLFDFEPKEFNLEDMGTYDLYLRLSEKYDGLKLHKNKYENKYIKNGEFIKAGTTKKINNLFIRSEFLKQYIPNMKFKGKYFFSYDYCKGNTLYELNNKEIYVKFLKWFEDEFCKIHETVDIKDNAVNFYYNKTINRLNMIKDKYYFNELDSIKIINKKNIIEIDEYIKKIDWSELANVIPSKKFHGDLQFDNIIYDGSDFKLIDWREDFGNNTEYGDLYYDVAKMYGGMLLNYKEMKNIKNYCYEMCGISNVIIKNYNDDILISILKNEFISFLQRNNLDLKRVKLLTALIYLNMSPLHINNFDKFLFLKSKYLFSEIFN